MFDELQMGETNVFRENLKYKHNNTNFSMGLLMKYLKLYGVWLQIWNSALSEVLEIRFNF